VKNSMDRAGLFGASLLALSAIGAAPAFAQQDAAAEEEEVIFVTGSRIARPGFTSNSPIATVGAEEIALQQPVDVEELLRDQPQFAAGNGTNVNNGSTGAATLDLRGLSEPRTLSLIDGKRMVGFGPNGLFDVSAVPLGLLERVDVVTGGASAVYGSDAIAGVVNFILNDDFQGLELRANHAFNDLHDTGSQDDVTLTMGASFDDGRGNVALAMNWLDREAVYQVKGAAALAPGASSTTVPAAFDSAVGARTQLSATGALVPFYQGFDFNGQNLYQSPQQRWGGTAIASYEINDAVEAYSRFIYQSSTSAPQLASSGTFGVAYQIPLTNPFLTPAASAYLAANNPIIPCAVPAAGNCVNVGVRWRAVDVGPRQYSYEYDTFQSLVGLRGDLGQNWEWDVAIAHGESSLKRQQNNDIDGTRVQQAFFAQNANTCFNPANFCVPLNIFNPASPPDPAALAFIRLYLQAQSLTTQEYAVGTITGDLGEMRSPFAESPIGVSFGVEYRDEASDYRPDAASQAGTSPGFGQTLPVSGHYDVTEFFGEALVPLVEGAPFADEINVELGYRTSDYSTSGRVESYKYGLDWAPVGGLRFRGMVQRAVRAASINELFGPFTPGTGDLLVDPCSGVTLAGNAALFNFCVATGVPNPAVLAQPTSGQVNNFSGGNPNLDPETADTITFGLVFRPEMAPGLSITVDYFDITVTDAISIRPAFDILDACYNPARNVGFSLTNADCALIFRNTIDGSIEGAPTFGVAQRTQNIGEVHVEGIDYSVAYEWDVGDMGTISASLDGTHLFDTSYVPSASAGSVDCLGFYGKTCGLPSTISASVGGPVSEDRWIQRTTWSLDDFEFSYRWRHISAVEIDNLTRVGGTITGTLDPDSVSIPDIDYIDLSAAWQVTEVLRLQANVTNVTGKEAPFVFTTTGPTVFNSGNTYPSTYDALGRVFTVGLTARF
jgi:iron complex outermembrane recepter protein